MGTSIYLDEDLKARVQRLAELRERFAPSIMREAIGQYLVREEARERFREEALEALQSYRTTGAHLTLSEVEHWLLAWGSGKDVEPPRCHG